MSNDFQDVSTAPTLTLEPFGTPEKKQPPVEEGKNEPALDEGILTDEERKMVDAFAQQIDLTDSAMVLQYGGGPRKRWRTSQRMRWTMCAPKIWAR